MRFSKKILLSALALSATALSSAQYWTVGDWTTPYAVNNNGQVAGYDFNEYFKWSPTTAYTSIGGVIPGNGHGGIPSISHDGTRIGGTSMNTTSGKSEISYYDVATNTWTQLGSLGSFSDAGASAGFAMSGGGDIVVGNAWVNAGNAHAVKWQNGSITDLGSLFEDRSSRADGVSDDGSLIGGYQDRVDGYRSGAVWLNGTEMLLESGGEPLGAVHAVSGDGQWAVGEGAYALNGSAYMWNPGSGLTTLDNPWAGQGFEMYATAVNYDGSVVIGLARDPLGWGGLDQGWIWTAGTGTMSMEAYATSIGVYNGDYLTNPLGISPDGKYIVGQGLNAEGTAFIGWAMHTPVPEPATMVILGGGLLAVLRRRRK